MCITIIYTYYIILINMDSNQSLYSYGTHIYIGNTCPTHQSISISSASAKSCMSIKHFYTYSWASLYLKSLAAWWSIQGFTKTKALHWWIPSKRARRAESFQCHGVIMLVFMITKVHVFTGVINKYQHSVHNVLQPLWNQSWHTHKDTEVLLHCIIWT